MIKTTKRLFLSERFIFGLILINSILIFMQGFTGIGETFYRTAVIIDNVITLVFILEIIIKIRHYGWKVYIEHNWNKFDFVVVAISSISLLSILHELDVVNLGFFMILRVFRVFKFFLLLEFIPNVKKVFIAVQRAIRLSTIIWLGFLVYIFVISVFSSFMFKSISPEYFGDPLKSCYTTFRIFTIEGWYEIPDSIAKGSSTTVEFFAKIYFIFILITGGIFGLSLVNSIFVDSMVSDNNDSLERKVDELNKKIDELIKSQKSS